jgi:hypothetical protein
VTMFDRVIFAKSRSDCWDRSRALDSVGGDEEFLSELAGIFCAACPTLLESLEESIAAKKLFSAAKAAQLLGHAAQNLAATGFMQAALAVKMMARRNELEDIGDALHAMRQEAGRLVDALAAFSSGRSALPAA